MSAYEHMASIDGLPREWRELVYEYGFTIVAAMYDAGGGIDAVRNDLETWRHRRQEQWLRTDYLVPKSSFFAGVGGFKSDTDLGRPRPKIQFTI